MARSKRRPSVSASGSPRTGSDKKVPAKKTPAKKPVSKVAARQATPGQTRSGRKAPIGQPPAKKSPADTTPRRGASSATAASRSSNKKAGARKHHATDPAAWLSTISTLADGKLKPPAAWSATTRRRVPLMLRLTTEGDEKARVLAEAQLLRISEMLLEQTRMRVIARALIAKTSQDDIASSLGTSQATVSRLAGLIRSDPAVLEDSPTEVIAKRAIGEFGDDVMMKTLLACSFTSGQYDPTGGDGYLRGTWREIENALASGLISDEEYEQIAREAPVTTTISVGG